MVGWTATFDDAALLAVNLGGDADTIAAINGQLAGALNGESAIPDTWLKRLAWRERIEQAGEALTKAATAVPRPSRSPS